MQIRSEKVNLGMEIPSGLRSSSKKNSPCGPNSLHIRHQSAAGPGLDIRKDLASNEDIIELLFR